MVAWVTVQSPAWGLMRGLADTQFVLQKARGV
jgi:hypothetical protein